MEQFEREDTAIVTPNSANSETPNMEPAARLTPTPAPKKSRKLAVIFITLGAIIFLGLIGFATYAVLTINEKNDAIISKDKDYAQLQADNKKLVSENKKATDTAKAAAAAEEMAAMNSLDTSFVALAPNAGFVGTSGETTFEWTARKGASKYVVEIKPVNQATYAATYPADQTIVVKSSDPASKKLTLSKTLAAGSYVWRVTALHTMDDGDMVLQSTTDRNFQVK